jgi:hypothetical protein
MAKPNTGIHNPRIDRCWRCWQAFFSTVEILEVQELEKYCVGTYLWRDRILYGARGAAHNRRG